MIFSGLKGGRPLLRAAPSQYISKREAERIITMATKLLVATVGLRMDRLNLACFYVHAFYMDILSCKD